MKIREKLRIKYRTFVNDSLYKNSFILMVNSGLQAGLGFFFWTIASRSYGAESVGIMGSIVSSAAFILLIGYIGFDYAIIKNAAKLDFKGSNIVSLGLNLVIPLCVALGLVYTLTISTFSSKLGFISSSPGWIVAFLLIIVVSVFINFTSTILLAKRLSKFILISTVVIGGSRVIITALSSGDHKSLVLMYCYTASLCIGGILSLAILKFKLGYKHDFKIDAPRLKSTAKFNLNNYLSSIANSGVGLILPTMILSTLGAKQSAYFYIPNLIVGVLNMIPLATAQSFYAETSWDEKSVHSLYRKSLKASLSLMIPIFIALVVFGKPLLSIFGSQYPQNAYPTLVILAAAALVQSFSFVAATLLRAKDKVVELMVVSVVALVITIGFSFIGIILFKSVAAAAVGILVAEISSATLFRYVSRGLIERTNPV